ncbi:hypothetical protein LTR17_023360 [Elasticomyces elasticus]|nr:hypothetical protein LTR17_023360 [Elasticomyces elasticus]
MSISILFPGERYSLKPPSPLGLSSLHSLESPPPTTKTTLNSEQYFERATVLSESDVSPTEVVPNGATWQETELGLIRLSIDVFGALLTAHDWDSPLIEDHLSPRVVNRCWAQDQRWAANSRQELVDKVRSKIAKHPDHYFSIREDSVSAEINDEEGLKATVWVPATVKGFVDGDEGRIVREWIVQMHWRRRTIGGGPQNFAGRRWVCVRMIACSAAGGFVGMV